MFIAWACAYAFECAVVLLLSLICNMRKRRVITIAKFPTTMAIFATSVRFTDCCGATGVFGSPTSVEMIVCIVELSL